jgi:twinkle protein
MGIEEGAKFLDKRIIRDDSFDWRDYDADTDAEYVKVKPASDLMDDVIATFYQPDDVKGEFYPWAHAQKLGLRFRPGELTLYGGHSGSYKSILQSQIALSFMETDARCMIASFEMRPRKTLGRMVRQAAAEEEPPITYMKRFKGWTQDRLWLYDHFGNVDQRKVLAVCRYAARELGCKHLFIDSLMKVLDKTDDYNEQKAFVGKLCTVAQSLDVHVHLVAHSRKKADDTERIGKFDIHGAGEMEKQADNVLMIQRNRKKGADPEDRPGARRGRTGDLGIGEIEPDIWLTVDKQREGAFEGTLAMGFDPRALCVVELGKHQQRMSLEDRDE